MEWVLGGWPLVEDDMEDNVGTKEQLLQELDALRSTVTALETLETGRQEGGARESAEIFQRIFEVLPDPSILWERQSDGRIVLARINLAAMNLSKDGVMDFMGATAEAFFEQVPQAADRIKRSFDTREKQQTELFYRLHNTGEDKWLLIHCSQVTDNLVLSIVEDITERRRSEERLRRRNRELALLNRAGQAFISTLNLDQVFATTLDQVRSLLGVTACSVWLMDPEMGEVICQAATGPKSEVVRGWTLAPGQGLVGWVARHGKSLNVTNIRADPRHFVEVDQKTGIPLRSILSVPLRVRQGVIGVLQVVDTKSDRFGPSDLAMMEALSTMAAMAIENARLYAEEQKRVDALTHALQRQRRRDRA